MNREAEIFAEAIELAPSERASYVDHACGDNAILRATVEALLRGHAQAQRVFATPVADRPKLAMATEEPGTVIGRYTLLKKIGEGGCGVVWRAEQREPVRREVALKVIKLGMDTREVISRFEAERQALALMDHPNIARVFDGGATESGRPFFVMEYVRGVSITRYCDEQKLPTPARIELFIQVCHAVQHAHQKGIIHRDLKPSNILATDGRDPSVVERLELEPLSSTAKPAAWSPIRQAQGTQAAPPAIQPSPKVIDFGIAKATQGRLTDATVFTAFEQFIGTPVYMSPEQAAVGTLDIDTRSDIYSLGVLLYELLTGLPPFDAAAWSHAGVDQVRQQIREIEAPRPSTRLSTLGEHDRTTIARRRNTTPAELSIVLRGDLDWIVMRCLEKDRARRYDTANGLAMDLQRFLRNEPVLARPPSKAYLLRKLVRRNRVAFAGIAAVTGVLAIGAVVSTWQAIRASQAENAERQLRERAVEEQQLGLKRSSRTDFQLGSRLLDEGNAGEGLAYLVRAARSDARNSVVGPRLISALVTRNFLLPERAPLQLPAAVRWLSCTSDGSEVFVLGGDGIIRVLDGSGSRVMRERSFTRKVLSVALAAKDRGTMAVSLDDNSMIVCDTDTGRARTPLIRPGQKLLWYLPPRLSTDGRWLAAASAGEVWIWDTGTGELRATLPHRAVIGNDLAANPARVSGFDFSPDAQRIATSAEGSYARIWSVSDGRPLTDRMTSGNLRTNHVRFSPDGRLIVVATSEGAQLRDAGAGALVGPLFQHDMCTQALFTPDGHQVITASGDYTVKIWDIASGRLALPVLRHGGPIYSSATLEIADDGRLLLTTGSDGFTRVWDMRTGQMVAEPALQQAPKAPTTLSPDGRRVFVGTNRGLVFALRLERGSAQPLVLPRGSDFFGVGLASAPPARLRRFTANRMEVIDVASGREVAGGFAFPKPISSAWGQVRSDGRFVAVQTEAGKNEIWEVIEGRVRITPLHDAPDGDAWFQFSATNDLLSMASFWPSPIIRVWSLHTGRPVAPAMKGDVPIFSVSHGFCPDAKRLAAGGIEGGMARVWDVATARVLFDLKPIDDTQVNRIAFSPDGTRIATTTSHGEVRLWDGMNGRPISPSFRLRTRADGAVFSPDGRTLASSAHDGTTRLWNAGDGSLISETPPLSGRIFNVQFNADGTRVATLAADGTARIWDAQTGSPLTDLMRHNVTLGFIDQIQAANGQFSPGDGRLLCTFSASHIHLWPVPPDGGGASVPEWLLRLATICAGKRVTPDGVLVDASDEVARLDDVRREIAALPAESPFVEWGRWFLADRATRSIAPGFTITPAEAERLAVAMSDKKS